MHTESARQFHGRIADNARQMRHMLAEKGARAWTSADQTKFDQLGDAVETAEEQLAALSRAAGGTDAGYAMRVQASARQHRLALREGFEIFLRKADLHYTPDEARLVKNTMSTTTPSEGGNTVSTVVARELVDSLKYYGSMRRVASQVTTTKGSNMGMPASDGTAETGELMVQNAPATTLDPTFSNVPLNTYKIGSKIFTVPIELLQDGTVDIVAFLVRRARDRIGRTQNQLFTTGTGTGQPNGLVTAASVGKTGLTGQTLTIIYDDLVDLVDSVDEAYHERADNTPGADVPEPGWMMSGTMRKVVRKVKDSSGRPIWTPSYTEGVSAYAADRLLGFRVTVNNDMPVPAANAKSLAFGDMAHYLIRDALELNVFRFDDSAFALKGQVGFMAVGRSGGNLLDAAAVKLYAHSAT